ncbi:hypothetical protein BE08_40825 [Sorangium cellulosum]|uniref:Carrier domain-containing protein n=1 Tax=Sorangium cellulosum TaxID=56 RepID=A0A150P198_SORCE|nr:hypothetical protein BE08_40825 [Sorangium cellulosum]
MTTVSFLSRRAKKGDQPTGLDGVSAPPEVDVDALADVWRSILRVDHVSPEDNFFELGGTSLHAMLMASRMEKLSVELSLVGFFEDPTFAGLCASVTVTA